MRRNCVSICKIILILSVVLIIIGTIKQIEYKINLIFEEKNEIFFHESLNFYETNSQIFGEIELKNERKMRENRVNFVTAQRSIAEYGYNKALSDILPDHR